MKTTKWELAPMYGLLDRVGVAAHLEAMAARGWMLDKMGTWRWKYRRMEPKKLRFAVTFFSAVTPFDPEPTEELETYRDYCAAAGWQLAAAAGAVQVFFHEDEHAVPIETDPAAEYENIRRFMGKSCLPSYWAMGALALLEICFQIWRVWTQTVDVLSDNYSVISALTWIPIALLAAAELICYYRWRKKARAAAEQGQPLPGMRSARKLSILTLVWTGLVLLLLLLSAFQYSRGMQLLLAGMLAYMALMYLLARSAQDALKHLRVPSWVNIAVTFGIIISLTVGGMAGLLAALLRNPGTAWLEERPPVETYEYNGMTWRVYDAPIPLRIEDLVSTDYTQWSTEARVDSSFLLTHGEYSQRPRMDALSQPDLDYELVIIKAPFLYDLCKHDFISWLERDNDQLPEEYWDEYRLIDAPAWGAEEVYQQYHFGEPRNQFLVCWPGRIAEVKFDWDWTITEDMMATAGEHLRNT